MPETPEAADLSALDDKAWLAAIDDEAEERGYFEPVGPHHSALFTDEGPVLLVTFESIPAIRARGDQRPMGWALAAPNRWSQLTLMADSETWFRDKRVYGYFDRLVDDGFFEDFDRVIFLGAGMGGYAACAFSVAAPGATVLAIQAQATLDPERAGWDPRFADHRRLNFTDRYGFAPHMAEAADRVFLFFDPGVEADAIHAAFFTAENCHAVRMRHFGDGLLGDLDRMGLLAPLLDAAASESGLTLDVIHRALRARKDYLPYLRTLLAQLSGPRHLMRLGKVARLLSQRYQGRRFDKVLAETEVKLKARGLKLPPQRMRAAETA